MVVNILARYDFSQLVRLNLSKMHFTNMHLKLLEGTNRFPRLNSINLAHNRLRSFPLFLVGCRKLQMLDLSYNLIEELDSEIGKLANLKELSLWNNGISALP
jgi:Leucine-rich repeat (LRR) protein